MNQKTWPYGTKRRATVVDKGDTFLAVVDDEGEGHVLLFTSSSGEVGDVGEVTFVSGGPMGGYWSFNKTGGC